MILFSFVGLNDDITTDSRGGAVRALFYHYKEDLTKIYLFANSNPGKADFVKIAEKNQMDMNSEAPDLKIDIIKSEIVDPTNHQLIYQILTDELEKIMMDDDIKNSKKVINISSGTPTMATCWVLMVQSGLIPNSILVQATDPRFRRQVIDEQVIDIPAVKTVDLTIDNFPQITAPEAVKRELNRTKVELDVTKESKGILELDKDFPDMVGQSESIRDVKAEILKIAPTDFNIFIIGETGTGKELVAKHLVEKSTRNNKPFRIVNFGHKSEQLIESELFGHKKGAFTGADSDRKGLFKTLDGGTLFIDEIGELPVGIQSQLLRVIEYGDFTPVGADYEEECDVRVIAATNADIAKKIESGDFRKDFLHRFQYIFKLPNLNKRFDDFRILIEHFIKKHNLHIRFSDECVKQLKNRVWSGNVRQLENLTRQCATIIKDEPLEIDDIPEETNLFIAHSKGPMIELPLPENQNIDSVLADIETEVYERALLRHNNNKEKAAQKDLHIEGATLRKRLRNKKSN